MKKKKGEIMQEIPEQEKIVDSEDQQVTQEEMRAEMEKIKAAMRQSEAVDESQREEDQLQLEEVRKNLRTMGRDETSEQTQPLVTEEEMNAELKNMLTASENAGREDSSVTQEEKEAPSFEPKEDREERLKKIRETIKKISESKTPEQRKKEEAELIAAMKEAMRPDWEKGVQKPKPERKGVPPEEPPAKGDGHNEEDDSFIMHHGQANIERKTCPVCKGTGRKFLFLTCWRCYGYGSIGVNKGMTWSEKRIKRKKQDIYLVPPEKSDDRD